MWVSNATTHTCRGKGQKQYCCRCSAPIQFGQLYQRHVWRPGKNTRLQAMVEHLREEDCEQAAFDLQPVHTAMAASAVALTMVLKERIVARETVGGEMVHEIELYTDLEIADPDPWPDCDYDALIGFDFSQF